MICFRQCIPQGGNNVKLCDVQLSYSALYFSARRIPRTSVAYFAANYTKQDINTINIKTSKIVKQNIEIQFLTEFVQEGFVLLEDPGQCWV